MEMCVHLKGTTILPICEKVVWVESLTQSVNNSLFDVGRRGKTQKS